MGARDHVELGTDLGVLDIESAASVSGTRFGYLMGGLVRLEFALIQFALDRLEPPRVQAGGGRRSSFVKRRWSVRGSFPVTVNRCMQ